MGFTVVSSSLIPPGMVLVVQDTLIKHLSWSSSSEGLSYIGSKDGVPGPYANITDAEMSDLDQHMRDYAEEVRLDEQAWRDKALTFRPRNAYRFAVSSAANHERRERFAREEIAPGVFRAPIFHYDSDFGAPIQKKRGIEGHG